MYQEPLCGHDWYRQHRHDYTQADIDSLGIEVSVSGKVQARVQAGQRKARGIIKEVVEVNR